MESDKALLNIEETAAIGHLACSGKNTSRKDAHGRECARSTLSIKKIIKKCTFWAAGLSYYMRER